MVLPADGHVHSEWSWDAPGGSMERTCARAVEVGLPAVAFTEHADWTPWTVRPEDTARSAHLAALTSPDGVLTPPPLDLDGYLECLERCRDRFAGLRIISGVELGEPHRHADAIGPLLAAGRFDRVLGSLHSLPVGDRYSEMPGLFEAFDPVTVLRDYLAELAVLVAGPAPFGVLAHIDYPVRYWPVIQAGRFDPRMFEDEYRHALHALAGSGRVLEVNTRVPLDPRIVRWWHEEGGTAVTFGSDAHDPARLALGLPEAAAMVEAHGFRPGRHPYDVWHRTG